jgi:O-antigen ligase
MLGHAETSSSAWPVFLSTVMAGVVIVMFGVDPRVGAGFLAALLSVLVLIVRVEWLAYAVVAATVIFVDGWAPTRSSDDVPFRLGIGRMYLMEFPIYLLFLAYLLRSLLGRERRTGEGLFANTPLDWPLRGWLIVFPVFAVYGVFLGHPAQDALGYFEWRCLLIAILFYFLVTSLFRNSADLEHLWQWFFLLVTAKALYSLLLFVTQIAPRWPLVFGQGPVGEGPENVMYLFAALPAISILIFHAEERFWRRAALLFGAFVLVANIAVSEKRAPQVGLLIGLGVLGWRLPRREKIRWGLRLAGAAALALVSSAVVQSGSNKFGLEASTSRYSEIVEFVRSPGENVTAGDTLAFHVFDIFDAWETIQQRPLLGYGFGGQTERNLSLLPMTGGNEVGTGLVHNQYLTFWLKMGIAGPLLFLWLLGSFFLYCRRRLQQEPRTIAASVAAGICAAVWADVAMEFWGAQWISNTKNPLVIFLNLALAVGFLNLLKRDEVSTPGGAHA